MRTVVTAGRAVVFSGFTVAVSLGALLVFPVPFLRSFAYAGIGVVAMAVIAAVIVLPAMLAALGDRVEQPRHPRPAPRGVRRPPAGAVPLVPHRPVRDEAAGHHRRRAHLAAARSSARRSCASPPAPPTTGCCPPAPGPARSATRCAPTTPRRTSPRWPWCSPRAAPTTPQLEAYAIALSTTEGVSRVDTATGVYVQGVKLTDAAIITDRYRTDGRAVGVGGAVGRAAVTRRREAHRRRAGRGRRPCPSSSAAPPRSSST